MKSQLDYIIGPTGRRDDVRICNDNKAWATWDHYPIHARIYEDFSDVPLRRRWKKKLVWLETKIGGTKEGIHEKTFERQRRVPH